MAARRGRSRLPAWAAPWAFVAILATPPADAQQAAAAAPQRDPPGSPVGLWETVSDVDGRPKGHIRITEVQGELRGVVEVILDPKKREAVCDHCKDERRNQPVLGMTVLTGMRSDGDGGYAGGRILDPDNGNVYSCKLALADGGRHLRVRGYLGISLLGRTQVWNRLD